MGTLDAEEVVHWVSFCLTVIRTCEKLAGAKDRLVGWRERECTEASLDEMLDLLQIEDPVLRGYWRERGRRWPKEQVEEDDEFAEPVEWGKQCRECEWIRRNRALARRQRTNFQQGWRRGKKWKKLTRARKKALKQRQRKKRRSAWKAEEAERLKEGKPSAESVLWGQGEVESLVGQFGKVSDWCDERPMEAGRTPGGGW